MKIGIIGAMDEEISTYKDKLEDLKEKKHKIFTFYSGKLSGKDVVLVKSGVGKVFAAMVSQYLIDEFNVDMILFTGVGGSLNDILEIGDVVVGNDSIHYDFDATALGFKRGQISYTDYRFFDAEKKLVKLATKVKLEGNKVLVGRILTGDRFLTQKERNELFHSELKGDCVEMEGAAVAQVCVVNEVPHLIIRTVSDKADGTAVEDYNKFKGIVAKNSFKIVDYILKNLKK